MLGRKLFWLLLFLFLTVFTFRDLLPAGYIPMHDDLQIGRLYQMDLCFQDLQIPCRWVPDMGYGYGYPLFNFYPPLPFYFGEIVHLIGLSFIDSIKFLFILGFIFSGLFAYLLGRELWGKYGGMVVAAFYLYAPYHAVDVYVRGALNEFWALVFIPAVFWAIYCLIKYERKIYLALLAFFFGLLLLSHNLVAFFLSPALLIWSLFLIWYLKKPIKKVIWLGIGGIWGIGLAAFFSFPVILEQKYVHIETMFMGYFNYLAHFATINQLFFSRFWGYGASTWGPEDGMPFPIGQFHWFVGLFLFILFAGFWFKKRRKEFWMISIFFSLFLIYAFLAHQRSSFIWQLIPILSSVQFPWRFVGLAVFFGVLISGSPFGLIKNEKKSQIVSLLMIIGVFLFNFSFFHPEKILKITDSEKLFSAKNWNKLQTDAIFDYLPIYAKMPPTKSAPNQPWFIKGEGQIQNFKKGTNWEQFSVQLVSNEATLQLPLYDFPGMKVWINGKETNISHDNDLGLITFTMNSPSNEIMVKLTNTPIRTVSNFLSLISWLTLVLFVVKLKHAGNSRG